jgi:hypothetical protein
MRIDAEAVGVASDEIAKMDGRKLLTELRGWLLRQDSNLQPSG